MAETLESKLDAIMNAIGTLSQRTAVIEGVFEKLHNDGTSGIAQPRIPQPQVSAPEEAALPVF